MAGKVDRTRQDADVMERVLGLDDDERPRSEVIDMGRPWSGGTVNSAVQITVPRGEHVKGRDPDERG
jgi:hypothetical protein